MCKPRLWSRHDGRFRDLDLETGRRQSGFQQNAVDHLGEIVAAELDRRQVDGDGSGNFAFGGVAAGGAQRPFTHFVDRFGFLGERNEFRRRNHAELRMLPSHQGFGAADPAVVERHLELVIQHQFLTFGRMVEIAGERAALAGAVVHFRAIHADRAALLALAAMHRELGIAQELIAFRRIGREYREADRGGEGDRVALRP